MREELVIVCVFLYKFHCMLCTQYLCIYVCMTARVLCAGILSSLHLIYCFTHFEAAFRIKLNKILSLLQNLLTLFNKILIHCLQILSFTSFIKFPLNSSCLYHTSASLIFLKLIFINSLFVYLSGKKNNTLFVLQQAKPLGLLFSYETC